MFRQESRILFSPHVLKSAWTGARRSACAVNPAHPFLVQCQTDLQYYGLGATDTIEGIPRFATLHRTMQNT